GNEQEADEPEKHACAAPERGRYGLFHRLPYRAAPFNFALSTNVFPVEGQEHDWRERHYENHGREIGGERPDWDMNNLRCDQGAGAGIGSSDECSQHDPWRPKNDE